MEFENIEQLITAMQSSQFSMEEKKWILIGYFDRNPIKNECVISIYNPLQNAEVISTIDVTRKE